MRRYLISLLAIACFASCANDAYITDKGDGTSSLTVTTRVSDEASTPSPINIYVFDKDGKEQIDMKKAEGDNKVSFNLATGKYTIAATAGSFDSQRGYSDMAFMRGKKSPVAVAEGDNSVSLSLNYEVAKVGFVINEVPAEVKNVSITLGKVYSYIDVLNAPQGTTDVTIPCTKAANGSWTTTDKYVLPGTGTSTTIVIAFAWDDGTSSAYNINYQQPLREGIPYEFTCTYQDDGSSSDHGGSGGITSGDDIITPPSSSGDSGSGALKVSIAFGEWRDTISTNLVFGDGVDDDGIRKVYVSEIPQACTVWNGHVVAACSDDGVAILLSLGEYANIKPANADPTEAVQKAGEYTEGDISDWQIPSLADAEILTGLHKENTTPINKLLKENGGTELNTSLRYLCNEAKSTMSFNTKGKGIDAAGTTQKYLLRLTHKIHFIKR